MYTLQYLKWIATRSPYCIAQGTLLNVTGNLDVRGVGENGYMYICMAESLCHPSETITTLLLAILQHESQKK